MGPAKMTTPRHVSTFLLEPALLQVRLALAWTIMAIGVYLVCEDS